MKDYLKLLRKQVDEEIDYLVRHGHDVKHPPVPCIFCVEFKGHNFCKRLADLRQFNQRLNMQETSEFRKTAINPEIKLPFLPDSFQSQHSEMPLMGFSHSD